jgi:hypothetical protein
MLKPNYEHEMSYCIFFQEAPCGFSPNTSRKMLLDRNRLCGAFKKPWSTKIFLWHIKKLLHKIVGILWSIKNMNHIIVAFCGAY